MVGLLSTSSLASSSAAADTSAAAANSSKGSNHKASNSSTSFGFVRRFGRAESSRAKRDRSSAVDVLGRNEADGFSVGSGITSEFKVAHKGEVRIAVFSNVGNQDFVANLRNGFRSFFSENSVFAAGFLEANTGIHIVAKGLGSNSSAKIEVNGVSFVVNVGHIDVSEGT